MMRLTGKTFQKMIVVSTRDLNKIHESRHFDPVRLNSAQLNAVWITSDAIQTEDCQLSYVEVESLLVKVGDLADRISTVSFFKGAIS